MDQYQKLLEILVIILDYLSSAQDYFISSTESSTASSVIVSILTADISSRDSSTAEFLSRGSTAEFSSADSKVTSSTAASTGTYSIQNNLTTIIKTRMTIFMKVKL